MSERFLPFSDNDLKQDMENTQPCRVCGRSCSSSIGLCRSPVCTPALIEQLEAELQALREAADSWLRWPTEGHRKQLAKLLEVKGE